jgi:hypothetical protein
MKAQPCLLYGYNEIKQLRPVCPGGDMRAGLNAAARAVDAFAGRGIINKAIVIDSLYHKPRFGPLQYHRTLSFSRGRARQDGKELDSLTEFNYLSPNLDGRKDSKYFYR